MGGLSSNFIGMVMISANFLLFFFSIRVALSQTVEQVTNVSTAPRVISNTGGIGVSWSPVNGSELYTACYSKVNGQTLNPPLDATCINITSNTSVDIPSLEPGIRYYVWVRAQSGGVVGMYSERVSTTTYNAPSVIASVTLVPDLVEGQPAVHVRWTEPQSPIPILQYVLNRRVSGSSSGRFHFVSAPTTTFYITELLPGTSYTITVLSESAAGQSHFTNNQDVTTYDVPPAVSTPTVFAEFVNSLPVLRVIWSQPTSSLPTSYDVQYRVRGTMSWATESTLTTSVFLEGLVPYTEYQVRVRAVSEIGNGSFSSAVTARTFNASVPVSTDPPVEPTTEPPTLAIIPIITNITATSRSLVISWSPVGNVTGATYTVWYSTRIDDTNPSIPPSDSQVLRGVTGTSVALYLAEGGSLPVYVWVSAVAPDGRVGPYSERIMSEQVISTSVSQNNTGLIGGLAVVAAVAVVLGVALVFLVVLVICCRMLQQNKTEDVKGEHTYATAMHHRTLHDSGEYEDVCELTMTSSPAYQYSGTHINEGCMQ
jgi:hypothetical protein